MRDSKQVLYRTNGELRADISVDLTPEEDEAPPMSICRYAVLPIKGKSKDGAFVVYDRILCRIVNGVYYGDSGLDMALGVAKLYDEILTNFPPRNLHPNGSALGLIYPS